MSVLCLSNSRSAATYKNQKNCQTQKRPNPSKLSMISALPTMAWLILYTRMIPRLKLNSTTTVIGVIQSRLSISNALSVSIRRPILFRHFSILCTFSNNTLYQIGYMTFSAMCTNCVPKQCSDRRRRSPTEDPVLVEIEKMLFVQEDNRKLSLKVRSLYPHF